MMRMRTPSSMRMEPARLNWALTPTRTEDHSTTGMLAVTAPASSRSTRSNHTWPLRPRLMPEISPWTHTGSAKRAATASRTPATSSATL